MVSRLIGFWGLRREFLSTTFLVREKREGKDFRDFFGQGFNLWEEKRG